METQTAQNARTTNPSQEEIAARAYQIWEASGRQSGNELKHWLQAEGELARGQSQRQKQASTELPQRAGEQLARGQTPKQSQASDKVSQGAGQQSNVASADGSGKGQSGRRALTV